jgi:hypothetical protein
VVDRKEKVMSNMGLGVMLGMLSGNKDTIEALKASVGKEIIALELVTEPENEWKEDELLFTFADESQLGIWDGGRSCCESRYMTTDDTLQDFVGATFDKVELRDAETQKDEYGDPHEIQFLLVTTRKGVFTVETHNEHNGYYGGFYVKANLVQRPTLFINHRRKRRE